MKKSRRRGHLHCDMIYYRAEVLRQIHRNEAILNRPNEAFALGALAGDRSWKGMQQLDRMLELVHKIAELDKEIISLKKTIEEQKHELSKKESQELHEYYMEFYDYG